MPAHYLGASIPAATPILIFDEPTGAMDRWGLKLDWLGRFRRLADGSIVVILTTYRFTTACLLHKWRLHATTGTHGQVAQSQAR
jgi:hypothetical protein